MSGLTVFYDGACMVCHREISHYKKRDKYNLLKLVDISSASFNAEDLGLKTEEVNLHMHTMDDEGKVYKGVDSFVEIWKRLPGYKPLISLFNNQKVRPLIDSSYNIFTKHIRPRLPKRKCEDGQCHLRTN
jgi:predicted DCC family thiol-disulfide oxidoreductase YuxK